MKIWSNLKSLLSQVLSFFKLILQPILRPVYQAIRWTTRKTDRAIRIIGWTLLVCFGATVVVFFYYVYLDAYFYPEKNPDIKAYIDFQPPATGIIRDKSGEAIIELAKESQYRKIISYSQIPPVIIQAILSAEDERFFHKFHYGIDYKSITRAALWNSGYTLISVARRKPEIIRSQGASTIEQQTVRLWFLSEIVEKEKSYTLIADNPLTRFLSLAIDVPSINSFTRKLVEIKLAVWLKREMIKKYGSRDEANRQIFMRFANYTYFVNGRYGIEAASEYLFGASCQDFTVKDADKAALLAGMIKSPGLFAPRLNQSEKARERQIKRRNDILELMYDNSYLSYQEKISLSKKPLELAFRQDKTIAPSVINNTLREARRNGFNTDDIYQGITQLQLTIDLRMQKIVNEALENGLKAYEARHPQYKGQVQGAVVILRNNDGAILAEVGGRQRYLIYNKEKKEYEEIRYRYSDLNRVTGTFRQPGSAFKPLFAYMTAIVNGYELDDFILDVPMSINMGYKKIDNKWVKQIKIVKNYSGGYKGKMPMRRALAESRNAATIWLTRQLVKKRIGISEMIYLAKLLGIETPLKPYPTTSLGASEVNLLELTNAYRAIASGKKAEPYMIAKIADRSGKTVFEKEPQVHSLPLEQAHIEMMQELLRGVVLLPGGTAYSLTAGKFPIPVAGKTGTTNDNRDNWFVGFTYGDKGITTGIWIGFDDNRELGNGETGARTALPIAKEILEQVYKKNLVGPIPQFPEEMEKAIYRPLNQQ